MFVAARQAKKEFKMRRGSHYSGEGEVMKRFRAGIINIDDEEDDDNEESAIDVDDDDDADKQATPESVNGVSENGTSRSSRQGRRVPPVPPLANGA